MRHDLGVPASPTEPEEVSALDPPKGLSMTNIAKPTEAMIEAADRKAERRLRDYREWKRQPREIDPEDAGREVEFAWGDAWKLGWDAARSSAPQEPDDELIERLKDMRDFCRGTTHTHPHPNNVARLCEDVLAILQAKAPQ